MQQIKEFGQSVVVLQENGLFEKTERKNRWWGRKFKTNKNKKQMWHMRTITREWQRRWPRPGKQIIGVFSFTHSSSSETRSVLLSTVLFCFLLRSQLSTNHTVSTGHFFFSSKNQTKPWNILDRGFGFQNMRTMSLRLWHSWKLLKMNLASSQSEKK